MFKVTHPGVLTTIQDLGREGYQKYGLSVSGAVDPYAHRMANVLAGNDQDAATLEITLMGLKLTVMEPAVIAVTGGDLNLHVNGKPAPVWTSFQVNTGDQLHFKGCRSGCRAYLAVFGGIEVDDFLGSKATDLLSGIGGMDGRALKAGDVIHVNRVSRDKPARRRLSPDLIPVYEEKVNVRVILGPQDDAFTREGIQTFLSSEYTISKDSDGLGCRLEGPAIEHVSGADILSEGIFLGAIQVPKNGQPIVFQAGRRSVGGYTKIGGVITVDLPLVAQLKPNDRITFEEVTLEEAHTLLREQEKIFKLLNVS